MCMKIYPVLSNQIVNGRGKIHTPSLQYKLRQTIKILTTEMFFFVHLIFLTSKCFSCIKTKLNLHK